MTFFDYKNYLKSKEWKNTKKYFLGILGKKCSICSNTKGIHLHHLTYEHIGRELLEDVIPVCLRCHNKIHKLRKRDNLSIKTATMIIMIKKALK